MPIKVTDSNPINPILSCMTAFGEEGLAAAKHVCCCANQDTIAGREEDLGERLCKTVVSAVSIIFESGYDFITNLIHYLTDLGTKIVGGKPNWNNVNEDALSASLFYAVNRSRIHEVPVDATMDTAALSEVEKIGLDDLVVEFDRLMPGKKNEPKRRDIEGFVNFIKGGLETIASQPRDSVARDQVARDQLYYQELERYVLNIIYELRNPDISEKKKCEALVGLADANHGCPPRRYKEAKLRFERMTERAGIGPVERLDQQILLWLKGFKEDIIVNRYQDGQFHVINNACFQVRDWGLGGGGVELNDPYMNIGSFGRSALNYRYTLNKEYTPARMIDIVKTHLDDEDTNHRITPYFQARASELPENYAEQFFDPDTGKLNHTGVAWILYKQGFLSWRLPIL